MVGWSRLGGGLVHSSWWAEGTGATIRGVRTARSAVASDASMTATDACASLRMLTVRSTGHMGSHGKNVEPALNDASCERGREAVRLRMRALTNALSSSMP